MFRAFSNMPIFTRFAIATIVPILVIILLANFALQSSEARSQAVHISFDAQNTATREQINLQRMNALLQARFAQIFAQGSLSLEGDPSSGRLTEDDVSTLETGFNQTLATYQRNYEIATSDNMSTIRSILISDASDHGQQVIPKQHIALDTVIHAAWPHYQALVHKLLKDLATNTFYQVAYADFYQVDLGFLELKNVWQQVVDTATEMSTTVAQIGPSLTNPLLIYTSVALTFTLLLIIVAGFVVNSTIIFPLRQLVALTKRVEQGDTSARANIRGRDEINQVASAMNGMLDHILHLMQEAQSSHAELQAQIQQMSSEVKEVGEGNLQIQVHIASNELGMLANTFNVMAGELNTLVVNVKILARGVQSATLQAFGYTEQLVDNANEQIQHITQAAGEVGQGAAASRKIAERAQKLSDVAHEARQTAHKGRKAIEQSIKGMDHINQNVNATSKKVLSLGDRSREIRNIVEVIASIAQQTNRLALDASIQAAMAGEHGKAFGAVAVDIRRLAERAKEQSALIAQIVRNVLEDINAASISIRETVQETTAGTQTTQEVGNALELMFSVVEHQASEIEATNQLATQQLHSSNRVVQMMQRVSDSTRQSSGVTRNVAQQMEGLAQLAGQLLASVDVFKLREDRPPYVVVTETKANPTQEQLALNSSLRVIPSPTQPGKRAYGYRSFSGFPGQSFFSRDIPYPPPVLPETPLPAEKQDQREFQPRKSSKKS